MEPVTVQQLIDKLLKVVDKTKVVTLNIEREDDCRRTYFVDGTLNEVDDWGDYLELNANKVSAM